MSHLQQQTILRDAMRRLNMTRDAFAGRIGVTRRALDTWLLPDESPESRAMPEIAARYVAEILSSMPQNGEYTQSAHSDIEFEGRPQLLSIDQFSRESAEALFRTADMMQPIARRKKITRVLEGAVLANLFFEASTRTRVSFGAAFARLGGSVCDTTGFTFSSMAKGESIYDTSRVISGYADAIVVRHPEQGSVAEFARATNIPVINAGDGPGEHPSQALLDLYTIQREFSRLGKIVDGAHIAMVGDLKYGRTVHSLAKLLSLYKGLKFTLVSPGSLEMPAHIIDRLARNDHVIEQTSDLRAGLAGADVVYATRIQKERFADESIEGYTPDFQINQALVDAVCGRDTLIMHPLPRDSRPGANDLATDLNHDSRLAIFRQTDNGIAVRMAIFAVLLGVEHQVRHSMRDAAWKSPVSIGPDDAVFQGFD
ncbi:MULTISPECIES: aspartate carbamoyltransferase [unclassified Caballeronia]|uniref:aspartate carbamoyltransferase n=1 Tax=unclassified Caballeronia TaxID=2646786 RepID=UPI002859FC6A|nr:MULTISPECIES: aspartate carbamoyltransferase [unclassified Caballeronia]MDR5817659.1 aspartate carbamoyltransferase [Caballeronia sp. LZ033]MDR5882494.1 aspartate carbamoyltransferase [Caballeronia sp. LZ032]